MRECGVLLPVASLPSKYGIGAFSKEAYQWVDTLKEAGQRYWQILPLGPTGYGDSPYQSFSAFAGNPYFIDLEELVSEELLTKEECDAVDFGDDETSIAYDKIYKGRFPLLRKAYERFKERSGGKDAVRQMAAKSLGKETREYCFYMAVKHSFDEAGWILWEESIRLRKPEVLAAYEHALGDDIGFYEFLQIKFEEQWTKLKAYANSRGILIFGDIPIYVAFDSADTWAHPELFQFDEQNQPVAVAGCPPDGFSATGQLWGNPLYEWDVHKKTEYAWWMERMEYSFRMYDLVRVDHFRGFDEYYTIPYGHETAALGCWKTGPGIDIFDAMKRHFNRESLPIIAEDLGFLTPSVRKLLSDTGFPGMKVLEFAFDSREESDYLPFNYGKNCVVYTGTHDNDTVAGWYRALDGSDRAFADEYLGRTPGEEATASWDFVRAALASVADLAVIPAQDYLGLGSEARVNTPSTLGENWKWRLKAESFDRPLVERIRRMAGLYGRAPR